MYEPLFDLKIFLVVIFKIIFRILGLYFWDYLVVIISFFYQLLLRIYNICTRTFMTDYREMTILDPPNSLCSAKILLVGLVMKKFMKHNVYSSLRRVLM